MKAVSVTNRGGRENNEDSVLHERSGDMHCFVVCDGLGGHESGEVASKVAAETVCEIFLKQPEISRKSVREYIDKAAERITLMCDVEPKNAGMSTTIVVLLTDGKKAVWAHVGDSRLYYINDGGISQITDDHSIAFMEFESGVITYDDIRRSPNQNKLLRCIGDSRAFETDVSDVFDVSRGDSFLMCTDGFWEYVTEDDIEETLAESASPKEWMELMLDILHGEETDYNDNYSAIAVMI